MLTSRFEESARAAPAGPAPAERSLSPSVAQVAVAIMRHISGPASNEAKAELMARQLHDKWGVGDGCGSGVLMLFATGDRQVPAQREPRNTRANPTPQAPP